MTVVFVLLYTIGLLPVIRRKPGIQPLVLILVVVYFMSAGSLVDLYLNVTFPTILWKGLSYALLIAIPTALVVRSAASPLRTAAAVAAGFFLILPVTRPTSAFLREGHSLKLRLTPDRFLENLARTPPVPADVAILERACGKVPAAQESLLAARLRGLELPPSDNRCARKAANWSGPHSSTGTEVPFRTAAAWREVFRNSSHAEQVTILNRLRNERNPALIDSAIECVGGEDENLILAAVRYLRFFSGRLIGNDRERWAQWRRGAFSGLDVATLSSRGESPLAARGFSAVLLLDDLMISRESGEDFLTRHLEHHFPKSITDGDVRLLEDAVAEVHGTSVPASYRKGVYLFFLALAESRLAVQGRSTETSNVYRRWSASLKCFQDAGDVGSNMGKEVSEILDRADANRDQELDLGELTVLLTPVR